MLSNLSLSYRDRYVWQRREDKGGASNSFRSSLNTGIFLIYPTVTGAVFAMLNCRQIGPDLSVVQVDYTAICTDGIYTVFVFLAIAIMITFVFGVPLWMLWKLTRRAELDAGTDAHKRAIQGLVAQFKCDDDLANRIVHELRYDDNSTALTSAFRGEYLFWEPVDMYVLGCYINVIRGWRL